MQKIKNRKRYVRKQKADTSKEDELDLLGDEDVESFTGSQSDLEGAADNLYASPPRPQPLCFESLSLKTPAKTVLPQIQLYNRKSSPNSRDPWVLSLTSNCSSKWAFSRLLCLKAMKSETNFSLSKRRLKKWRWIRPPLQPLSLVPVNKLRI